MREISINLRCDWDGCEEVALEGDPDDLTVESVDVTWDGETRTVDLCGDHAQFLADTLVPLMQNGRVPEGKKTKPKSKRDLGPDLVCRICGRQSSKVGMVQHVVRGHQYPNWAAYAKEFDIE